MLLRQAGAAIKVDVVDDRIEVDEPVTGLVNIGGALQPRCAGLQSRCVGLQPRCVRLQLECMELQAGCMLYRFVLEV